MVIFVTIENLDGSTCEVRLLGVLQGHEDMVSDVRWSHRGQNTLISAGMDKQCIIWHYEDACEAFMERVRRFFFLVFFRRTLKQIVFFSRASDRWAAPPSAIMARALPATGRV